MNKKVRDAIVYLSREANIVSSWGISEISIEENLIRFNVDGFIYKGGICIKCDVAYCEIQLDGGKIIRCSAQELTNVLDAAIEKDEKYLQNLVKWFSSTGEWHKDGRCDLLTHRCL